jgi:pyruvate/2-oxoglutarate dehydrogenase complex dihydrolipoamide acyltransferase (E2) component
MRRSLSCVCVLKRMIGPARLLRASSAAKPNESCHVSKKEVLGISYNRTIFPKHKKQSSTTWNRTFASDGKVAAAAKEEHAERPLEVMPSEEFWEGVYDALHKMEPESPEGVKIMTWHKKPRESVKVGDNILQIEAAGVILDIKAAVAGYLGRHLYEESAFLPRGEHAATITREPEEMPVVSDVFMNQEISKSEGSVTDLHKALDDVSALRKSARDDLAAACQLAAYMGIANGASSVFAMRVPGQPHQMYSAPYGMHYLEVTRDTVQTNHWHFPPPPAPPAPPAPAGHTPGDGESAHTHRQTPPAEDSVYHDPPMILAGLVLREAPASNCVLIAHPTHAAALSLRCLALSSSAAEQDAHALRRCAAAMLGLADGAVAASSGTQDQRQLATLAAQAVANAAGREAVVLLGGR